MRRYVWAFLLVLPMGCGSGNNGQAPSPPDQSVEEAKGGGREAQEGLAFIDERLHDADPSDDAFYRMVRDLGGFVSFEEALATKDTVALKKLHERYGLTYEAEARAPESSSLTAELLSDPWSDCIPRYPLELRNKTFSGHGMQVHIDAMGRPVWAVKSWVPWSTPVKGDRTDCQTTVGTWGNPNGEDAGGHLIPDAVGGWGGRANLVPQNRKLNNGPWSTVENQVTRCLGLDVGVQYRVTAVYPWPSTIRPSQLVARLALTRGSVTTAWHEASMANRAPTSLEDNTAANFKAFFVSECPAPTPIPTPTPTPAPAPVKVTCSVYDDGYTNVAGPSDAIFFSAGKACIPNGTSAGTCRKWFGRCTTEAGDAVLFKVFDDGGQAGTALSDSVFINADNKACIPNGTSAGECRKWFGDPETSGAAAVECRLFGDGYTSITGSTRSIYDRADQSCMPDGTATGTCRKWWGRCLVEPVPTTPDTPVCVGHSQQCDASHVCCGSDGRGPYRCVQSPRYGDNRCYSTFMDVGWVRRSRIGYCLGQRNNPFGYQTFVSIRQGWNEDGVEVNVDYRGQVVTAPSHPTFSDDRWVCGWPNAVTDNGLPLCPGGPGC